MNTVRIDSTSITRESRDVAFKQTKKACLSFFCFSSYVFIIFNKIFMLRRYCSVFPNVLCTGWHKVTSRGLLEFNTTSWPHVWQVSQPLKQGITSFSIIYSRVFEDIKSEDENPRIWNTNGFLILPDSTMMQSQALF